MSDSAAHHTQWEKNWYFYIYQWETEFGCTSNPPRLPQVLTAQNFAKEKSVEHLITNLHKRMNVCLLPIDAQFLKSVHELISIATSPALAESGPAKLHRFANHFTSADGCRQSEESV